MGLGVFGGLPIFGDLVLGGEGLGDPRVWWQRPCPWPRRQELQVHHEEVRCDGDLLPQKCGWEPQCHEAVSDRGAGFGGGSPPKHDRGWICGPCGGRVTVGRGEGREGFQKENLAPVGDSRMQSWLFHFGFRMSGFAAVDRWGERQTEQAEVMGWDWVEGFVDSSGVASCQEWLDADLKEAGSRMWGTWWREVLTGDYTPGSIRQVMWTDFQSNAFWLSINNLFWVGQLVLTQWT